MNTVEREIHQTLVELETAVAGLKTAQPKPDLKVYFARLDELSRGIPEGSAPELSHYLQRKSYQKARLWLEGRGSAEPPGGCRR